MARCKSCGQFQKRNRAKSRRVKTKETGDVDALAALAKLRAKQRKRGLLTKRKKAAETAGGDE